MTAIKKPVVCFLGPVASYTHQATLDRFPEDKYELLPVVTIKDVFDTTQSGRATYGVVPFENSTNGSVVFTLDHFADRQGLYPDLSVCAEIYLDVHHSTPLALRQHRPPPAIFFPPSLLASATTPPRRANALRPPRTRPPQEPRSRPLVPLTRIERIYSHPQAFGQCTRFLSAYLKGVETVDVSSTSRAAELVRDDPSGTSAAISSAAAARLLRDQGVEVLAHNIEDREDNTTRFFVLRADSRAPGPDDLLLDDGSSPEQQPRDQQKTKSLLSFTVPHTAPGALADVLSCFRAAGLNLTSIASRPSLEAPFQYVFFVEFEGHLSADPEGKVARVLEQVKQVAQGSRWLGSWVNQRR
ncbi:prephenate dehydratase [Apiospora kogelbergensis]|uniref:prephenate dehydratase n=1 Tax=Apiospora kogelbergensis TaxID=1337665 RepID=A0AAW0QWS9_9PEZI